MAIKKPLEIVRGKTTKLVVRWEEKTIIRKKITGINMDSGAPVIEIAGHGLTNGWRVYLYGIKGPTELNVEDPEKVRDNDYVEATVVDADNIELNTINAADFKPWVSGGFVAFASPKSLVGVTIRAKIKDKVGGTVLLSTELDDAPLNLITAVADDALKTILITISATTAEALTWTKGTWDVEGEDSLGEVTPLIAPSAVSVGDEVTTS